MQQWNAAIKDFDRAIQLDSNRTEYYLRRGRIYAQTGDYEQARKDWEEVLQISTDPELLKQANNLLQSLPTPSPSQ
jgi:regulator of sirC expression with transglutaminase-like and TPR domain